ncbi:MAG: hypothetical protein L6R35_005863 [Caloplaca aegaea]|nr:MAG: hypothetical protein L6R35_005863 [Caloplaca aegaea]
MDPLSITTSTLTLLSALEATFQLIKSYRDAPAQLEALNNEIADITATVTEVAQVLQESRDKVDPLGDKASHLNLALSKIREKAQELEALFRSCVIPSPSVPGGIRVSRLPWLRVKSRVQGIQAELREGRLKLSNALATFTASSSLRIELSVQDIFMVTKETIDHQRTLADRLVETQDQQQSTQDQFYAKVLTQLGDLQLAVRSERNHRETDVHSHPAASLDNTFETLGPNEHATSALQVRQSLTVPVHRSSRWDPPSYQADDWSSIGVRAELRNLSECSRSCVCTCHIRRRFNTARLLDGFLGTLFIGYSGSPILSQKCDQVSCRGRKDSSTSVVYQFPRWFVISRIIELKAKVTAMYGPEVSLRFNRVVDGKALVFHYATTGDTDKMRQLFEQGRASPSDVRFDSGWTPLHAGGDPYMETEAPTAAVDYAGTKILGNSADIHTINKLRELFFDTAFLEHGRFSDLHKVILQIRPGNILDVLERSTADLDVLDATGRSPLSWAAQRGEVAAVKLLLAYGANPNNIDTTKMTPMHYAAQATKPVCLQPLLGNGATITQQARGWTALHYICTFHDDTAYIRLLLDHGADVNTRTYVGKTALSLAIIRNHVKGAAFLIGKGADLDVLDNEGQSPLALAIKFGNLESLKLLLQSGAAVHKLSSEGDDTLIHLAAKFPNVRIIDYLADFDLRDVDLDARDKDGLTARELIQMHNSDLGVALAFQKMLRRAANRRGRDPGGVPNSGAHEKSDSDSTADVFEDAIE